MKMTLYYQHKVMITRMPLLNVGSYNVDNAMRHIVSFHSSFETYVYIYKSQGLVKSKNYFFF
jgi:hypothetical protein